MNKNNLRKIIRESIKSLVTEQNTSCYSWSQGQDNSTVGSGVIERKITISPAHFYGGCGPNASWGYSAHNITIDGATPQIGDTFYFPGWVNFFASAGPGNSYLDCCNNECPQQVFSITSVKNPTAGRPTKNWTSAMGGTIPNPSHSTFQTWQSANPSISCNGIIVPCTTFGCTDPTALNYNSSLPANCDDNSCIPGNTIFGCMNSTSTNYDPAATIDDGTCIASTGVGCDQSLWPNYSNWINTFTTLPNFSSPNPNQPCQFLCQREAQWSAQILTVGPNYANQLQCKLDDVEDLMQSHNCSTSNAPAC
jgi:hypothetical protein